MPKEPAEEPAERQQDSGVVESLSLVDYFDRMNRESFRRMLEDHDHTDSAAPEN